MVHVTIAPLPRSPRVTDVAVLCGLTIGAALAVRAGGGAVVVGSWVFAALVAATCAWLWDRFGRLELQAGLVGACCALMWWLIMVRATPATRAINVLWAGFALATLVTVSTFLR